MARQTSTAGELLRRTCVELVRELGRSACGISQLIGELLVQIAEEPGPRRTLQLGRGYLVSDYPLTRDVLERLEPAVVVLGAEGADPQEETVLRDLGFGSVLMLPFVLDGRPWALVEVYGVAPQRFTQGELERATGLVAAAAAAFAGLETRRAPGRR